MLAAFGAIFAIAPVVIRLMWNTRHSEDVVDVDWHFNNSAETILHKLVSEIYHVRVSKQLIFFPCDYRQSVLEDQQSDQLLLIDELLSDDGSM